MGILTRFTRLCRADIHGVIDQLEDKGLVLKQCLREMEEAIAGDQAKLNRLTASRDQALANREKYCREREKLDRDITAAIEKEKDAIARMLIRKLKAMDRHLEVLDEHASDLGKQIAALAGTLESRRQEYAQLKLRSETYFAGRKTRKWDESVSGIVPDTAFTTFSEEEVELELISRRETLKGDCLT